MMFEGRKSQRVSLGYAVWMRVRMLYFGVLKDVFGREGEELELAEGATVADLLRGFRGREGFLDSIAVAVNREYAKGEDVLKEGDEVALLPPVSGGSVGNDKEGKRWE
jgi:molybdopterin converting factor subunit 1